MTKMQITQKRPNKQSVCGHSSAAVTPKPFFPRAARQGIRPKRIPLANTSDKNDSAEAAAMPIPMAAM
jgi:hypothetical protein